MVFGYLLQSNVDTPLRVPSKNTGRDEKWKEPFVFTCPPPTWFISRIHWNSKAPTNREPPPLDSDCACSFHTVFVQHFKFVDGPKRPSPSRRSGHAALPCFPDFFRFHLQNTKLGIGHFLNFPPFEMMSPWLLIKRVESVPLKIYGFPDLKIG